MQSQSSSPLFVASAAATDDGASLVSLRGIDARWLSALLDPIRDRISQVKGPLPVDMEDEPYGALAVWRADATLGGDKEAVRGGGQRHWLPS